MRAMIVPFDGSTRATKWKASTVPHTSAPLADTVSRR